jgi:hypothetical protein
MKLYLGLARDIQVKRKIARSDRQPVQGDLYHRDVVLEYEIRNFKKDAVTLDITEDMNRLRDELDGHKDREAEWQIVRSETTLPDNEIERKDSHTVFFHIPLKKAPEGDAEVDPLTVKVHFQLRNEW